MMKPSESVARRLGFSMRVHRDYILPCCAARSRELAAQKPHRYRPAFASTSNIWDLASVPWYTTNGSPFASTTSESPDHAELRRVRVIAPPCALVASPAHHDAYAAIRRLLAGRDEPERLVERLQRRVRAAVPLPRPSVRPSNPRVGFLQELLQWPPRTTAAAPQAACATRPSPRHRRRCS